MSKKRDVVLSSSLSYNTDHDIITKMEDIPYAINSVDMIHSFCVKAISITMHTTQIKKKEKKKNQINIKKFHKALYRVNNNKERHACACRALLS